jgi:nucleotide sugar dehydrogenase
MNVGLIGVGRLGLAYALCFEEAGFNVIASSYKKDYVDALSLKKTDSVEPGIAEMLYKSKNIQFTTDNHQVIDQCDIVYVLVATPSNQDGSYDVSAVLQVAQDYVNHPNSIENKILIIGSTVNPGTTDQVEKMLSHRGVHVVYSPTFSAQGEVLKTIQDPHTISIGTTNTQVAEQCKKIFSVICKDTTPIYVMQPMTGEILKLAGNCRATINIAFANMIGQILIDSGLADDLKVATEYLSFIKLQVKWKFGYGYGGPCYPRDNRSFIHYTKSIGLDYNLGELIDNFNQSHVEYLTDYFIKNNVNNLPYYFEYVSYKKGVNIFEESHQLQVCKNLLRRGAKVFVEPSKFLLPLIQQELTEEFANVDFVSFDKLSKQDIFVYNVSI